MVRTDDPAVAWAAGVFEGEGYIGNQTSYGVYFLTRLKVTMTDEDVVRRFASVVGVGTVRGPRWIKKGGVADPRCKPYWYWELTGNERCAEVLTVFLPWLGARRSAKALEVIERGQNARKWHPPKTCTEPGCERKHLARGLCAMHHQRLIRAHGRVPDALPRYRDRSAREIGSSP